MTLTSTTTTVSYSGNGSTTAFSVTYHFFDEDEIEVYLISSTGAETLQDLGTDYTVTGGNGTTGTVTFGTAPATGNTVFIKRVTAQTQSVAYSDYGAFPAATHERALDRLTAEVQELTRDVDSTLRLPVSEGSTSVLPSADDRAGQVLGFDSNGDPVLLDPADLTGGSTVTRPYDLSFDFGQRAISASDRRVVPLVRPVTFAQDFAGSVFAVGTNPGADAEWTISEGIGGSDTVVGTATMHSDGTSTFSSVAGAAFTVGNAGNYLVVDPPSPADGTMAAAALTLKGTA